MKKLQKGFTTLVTIIIVIIVVILIVITYALFDLHQIKTNINNAEKNPVIADVLTKDWVEYTNTKYNISFKYPLNLTYKIRDNGAPNYIDFYTDDHTIVFHIAIINTNEVYRVDSKKYLTQYLNMSEIKKQYPDGLTTTTLDGETAFLGKTCFPGGDCTHQMYVARGDYYYELFDALILDNNINPQTLEGVLSTFKFIK